ncbi:MAG: hypothetical protein KGY70_18095, partial [Bacteroidales bacterium]|nr:hypothetical protein [Bacteroidales bacterium]
GRGQRSEARGQRTEVRGQRGRWRKTASLIQYETEEGWSGTQLQFKRQCKVQTSYQLIDGLPVKV